MHPTDLAGAELGPSSWIDVTQERVDAFAAATDDPQWIHVDPERAAAGPFGGTVAHGFLTLSLVVPMLDEVLPAIGAATINYGVDRVRFPAPVPCGSRIRGRFRVQDVAEGAGGSQLRIVATIEREGGEKPVCVAELLVRILTLAALCGPVPGGGVCYRGRPVGVVQQRSSMRSKRFTRVLILLAVVAAVAVPVAMAFGFDDGVKPTAGQVGTPYDFTFKGRNGCPPYTFVFQSGSLPPGLSMDSNGHVTGTPTQAGDFSFWIELRDSGCVGGTCPPAGTSCSAPSQRPFTISIADRLTVTTDKLAPATVNVPYSVKLAASGGGSQIWSIYSGSPPAGITLAPDGTLAGTATADSNAPVGFVVKVTDGTRTDTKSLSLDVVAPLAVTQPTFPEAEAGHDLSATKLAATGGRQPYTWAVAAGGALPDGIALGPDGTVSGTPVAAGSFGLAVTVTDSYGTTATLNLPLVVRAKVAVKTLRLPITKVGKLFKATLRTVGGVAPFKWKVTSGKFPVGIRLDRTTGVLAGKAQQAGVYPLTFTVTDAYGETSSVSLKLTVNAVKKHKTKT